MKRREGHNFRSPCRIGSDRCRLRASCSTGAPMSLQGAAGLEYVSLFGRQRRGVPEVLGTPAVIALHWAAELQMFHVKRARDKGVTC